MRAVRRGGRSCCGARHRRRVYLVAGPVAAVLPLVLLPFGWIAPDRPVLPWVALGAEVLAGVAIALDSGFRLGVWAGSGGYLAQALGAVALAAVALSLLPRPSRQSPSPSGGGDVDGACFAVELARISRIPKQGDRRYWSIDFSVDW